MLARAYRLRTKQDFDRVFRSGTSRKTRIFRLSLAKNTLEHSRFGIVIPNKVIKGAVERNRKKRQIRAAIQELLVSLPQNCDIVVFAQPGLVDATYTDIVQELSNALINKNR